MQYHRSIPELYLYDLGVVEETTVSETNDLKGTTGPIVTIAHFAQHHLRCLCYTPKWATKTYLLALPIFR